MGKFKRGDTIKAKDLEALNRAAQDINGITGSGSARVSKTGAGVTVNTPGKPKQPSVTLGSRELASVQGTQNTDLWTLGGSTTGCRWHDYTNLYYDDTTGKLMGYRRTITIDVTGRVVKVSAEGTAVEIVAFVECEAQP